MAKQTKKDNGTILFATGELQYFGYGTGKFGSSEKSQISIIPDEDVKELRNTLSELYMNAEIDEKWLPDFVAKDKDRINLASTFEIPVLVSEDGKNFETTLRKFCDDYGTPVKGTRVKVRMKFKDGSLYPVAVMFLDDLSDIKTYSLANLFE